MPRTSQLQTNFNAGELSPSIIGRTDYAPYNNGSQILENFSAHPQGWLFRRKGTRFVYEVKDSTKQTRIIPFSFNISQNLIIEMGAGYFRFFSNQAIVLTGGGSIYELANTFIESDLAKIRFVQKDDVIYMIHPLRGIFKLIRLANNNWTFGAANLLFGPYVDENVVSTNLVTITGTYTKGGTTTLTASGGHTPFLTTHVGGLWKVREGNDIAYLKITGFTSSTVVTCTNQEAIPASLQAIAKFTWSEGEFSLARSFPRAITFHEQRLCFAGNLNATQKIWFSKSGDFENFKTGTLADDAFNRTIAATSNDSILWLFSDTDLYIGTAESIWLAKPSANGAGISSLDFGAKKQISFGASDLPPVYADDSAFYLQRGDQKIRGLGYSASKDKLVGTDISIKSDHITGSGIRQFAYQMNPISTIFGIRADGQIANCVYEAEQEVLAWSRMTTQGSYESIASIPSASNYDEVYFIIKRTIGGVVKRYIEVLEPTFDYSNLASFFVDSGLTYNGTKQTTLSLSSGTGEFALVTQDGFSLITQNDEMLITQPFVTTATSGTSIFSAGDVGNQIHEVGGGTGRAAIIAYINPTVVEISIIESFTSANLLAGKWAVAVDGIGGLNHLIGQTVSIMGDGATIPDKIVSQTGTVAFDSFNSIIHAGLKYVSTRKSMPLEVNRLEGILGSSQGKLRRIDRVLIDFYNSRAGKLLDSRGKELTLDARSLVDNMNQAPALLDGNVKVDFSSDWDTACTLTLLQEEPQPLNVRSITYYLSLNDY
jgi:hypothetical protein